MKARIEQHPSRDGLEQHIWVVCGSLDGLTETEPSKAQQHFDETADPKDDSETVFQFRQPAPAYTPQQQHQRSTRSSISFHVFPRPQLRIARQIIVHTRQHRRRDFVIAQCSARGHLGAELPGQEGYSNKDAAAIRRVFRDDIGIDEDRSDKYGQPLEEEVQTEGQPAGIARAAGDSGRDG